MARSKVLGDLITSASSAKAHYEVWWAQVGEAKPKYARTMNNHSDFFHASADAHYKAFFVYFAHLYDKRKDSSSIPTYLNEIATTADPGNVLLLRVEYDTLVSGAGPLLTARHKTVAHVDAKLSEKDVFAPLNIGTSFTTLRSSSPSSQEQMTSIQSASVATVVSSNRLCASFVRSPRDL